MKQSERIRLFSQTACFIMLFCLLFGITVSAAEATGELGFPGDTKINAHVTLNGDGAPAMKAGDFEFLIKDAEDSIVSRGSNDAAGEISFDAIIFHENEVGIHTFTVSEVTDGLDEQQITPVDVSFTIQVNVQDNGDGTLTPVVIYPEGTDKLEFMNTYGEVPVPETGAVVTFKIVNGTWDGTDRTDKEVEIPLTEDKGTLQEEDVPTGMVADSNYEGGAWDVEPDTGENAITEDVIYTYTFTKKPEQVAPQPQPPHEYKEEPGTESTVPEIPKTGVRNSMEPWLILSIVSFGTAAVILFLNRRRRRDGLTIGSR